MISFINVIFLLFPLTLHASDLNTDSELTLKNLKVLRAEMPNGFESVLVLAREDLKARVTVVCVDGSGPLQSTITASFVDSSEKIQTRVFSGDDFYCWGAGNFLTAKLSKGQIVDISINLDVQSTPKEVISVVVTPANGTTPIISKNSATRWLER